MPSAGPAAKAALLTALTTACAAAAPDVQVYPGHPGPVDVEDFFVVRGWTSEQAPGPMRAGGPRWVDETLRLEVAISCWRGGDVLSQPIVEAACQVLMAMLESLLSADPTISNTVSSAIVESAQLTPDEDPERIASGRTAEMAITLLCDARITA